MSKKADTPQPGHSKPEGTPGAYDEQPTAPNFERTEEVLREDAERVKAGHVFEDAQWLWCTQCGRFFQAADLRPDVLGGRQACAFDDCTGAGFGLQILLWNASQLRLRDDWPESEDQLAKGLRRPTR